MLERKINLEEILIQENRKAFNEEGYSNYFTAIQHSIIQKAMKEACKQVLEAAAENADMIGETQHNNGAPDKYENFVYVIDSNGPDYGYTVNKQSILNTINQIE